MTYKNMKKIDKILYNIDCLILDRNKYFEDGTDAFYFVDAFQEVMFDAYFLKE